MKVRKGLPVSPGVAVGRAYCIDEIFVNPQTESIEPALVSSEMARFDEACEKTAADLRTLHQKIATQVGEEEADIFRGHEAILRDPAFRTKVRNWICDQRLSAPAALRNVLSEYTALFARLEDEYLRERLVDVQDVIRRLSIHLSEVLQSESLALPFDGPVIVVANDFLPSQAITLGDREVAGIVTQTGGKTSHAAILARSRGIPAVSGAEGILKQVKNGDLVILDGRDGHVFVDPDSETEKAYLKLQREFFDLKDQLAANRMQPAVSHDGEPLDLLANINNVADADAAVAMGASGVGLFRTEYLFLTHPDVPDEEEQLHAYRQIIAASPGRVITIRTLDLGGDKTVPYFGHHREANPFMGWRSIRLTFEHSEFFLRQIRAILRASGEIDGDRQVRLLFPMITTLVEVRKIHAFVGKARQQLEAEGHRVGKVPIGMMLEVPAAAITIETLLERVDFVSIGSNDLVQYLMAADRDNPKVAHLCQPLSPAVLIVLRNVIAACLAAHKPVTLCGEMAGMPKAFVLLFGMGLRSFSMSPSFIPTMKDLAGRLSVPHARSIVRRVLQLKTSGQIRRYMSAQLDALCPDLRLLDTDA